MASNTEIANRLVKVLEDPETYRNDLDLSGFYFEKNDYPSHIVEFPTFSKEEGYSNQIVISIVHGKFFIRCELMDRFEIIDAQVKETDRESILNILVWYLDNDTFPSSSGGYWFCEKYGFPDDMRDM